MSTADEIAKLAALRDAGTLSTEEFERAKARALGQDPGAPGSAYGGESAILRRSVSDRWLGGVCGGLANYFGVESWIWRLIFALFFFFAGVGVIPYLLLWIFVPSEADR